MRKKTNKESYAEAVDQMKKLVDYQDDIESNHLEADNILVGFLRQLGIMS